MSVEEDDARRLDQADPGHRELFHVPKVTTHGGPPTPQSRQGTRHDRPPADGGRYPEVAYLAGNSLGLQPKATRAELLEDLDAWAALGVEAHLEAKRPWLAYHEPLAGPASRLIGALPSETVIMNTLTVNLHLLMVSFYRPAGARTRILIEDNAFPSDSYAVRSHVRFRGLSADDDVVRVPAPEIEEFLAREGESVALVLLGGVNYLTGELLDIPGITALGQSKGAIVGWDLAHAAGNVPMKLHEWGADFAAWCSYKYLNAGPGALAGVFIHERHLDDPSIQRFEGWWSTDPETRFEMAPISRPLPKAEAWAISNPPIFSMGPVRSSLDIFDKVGIDNLRARSLRLTGYLESLLDGFDIVTPRDPSRRGCQLSIRAPGGAGALSRRLRFEHGVITDSREPDILRVAPVPLYNTFHDCWRVADALRRLL